MKKIILPILIIVLILGALGATLYLVKQRQDLQKQASGPGGTATVSLSPATGTIAVGQSLPVTIKFNTAGTAVSTVTVRVQYTYSGSQPAVTASNLQTATSLSGEWSCSTKTISANSGAVNIDLLCFNASSTGFTSSVETDLASFTLTANQIPATNPLIIAFDSIQSKIRTKADASDILLTPTSTGSYTITGGAAATPTPTPTPTPGGTATPTPTPTPGGATATPTPTPTPTTRPTATPTPTPAGGVGGPNSTPTPTPRPTSTPTPTPRPGATATPTPRPATSSGVPVTANFTPTMALFGTGFVIMIIGLISLAL